MSWQVTTPPSVEPVTLEEARLHLRVDDDVILEDSLIAGLITAARDLIERECELALMSQVWTVYADHWSTLALLGGHLREVLAIRYRDPARVQQTLPLDQVVIDRTRRPGRLLPIAGASFPVLAAEANAVEVDLAVGYANAQAVPGALRAALLLIVGDLFVHREAQTAAVAITENPALDRLLGPYRRRTL